MPGFITDALGLLLFIPPLREAAWRRFARRFVVVGAGADGGPMHGGRRTIRTIDLDRADYDDDVRSDTPWRRP
jgi:UPF0716 protein FxsA